MFASVQVVVSSRPGLVAPQTIHLGGIIGEYCTPSVSAEGLVCVPVNDVAHILGPHGERIASFTSEDVGFEEDFRGSAFDDVHGLLLLGDCRHGGVAAVDIATREVRWRVSDGLNNVHGIAVLPEVRERGLQSWGISLTASLLRK